MDETLDQTPPLDSLKSNTSGATLEMGKPKAGALGVSGKTNLGPDQTSQLLANMQAELNKRNSPMSSFLGGLQRASAWGSGGVNGPSAALTAMDREEMLRGQETRAMQEKMLAIQANQAAKERFLSSVGYGQPGAATAQPGAAPAAQAGQMPAAQAKQLPEYLEVISRLPLNYRGAAMRAIEGADQEAWNAIIAAAEKNRTPEDRNLELIERTPPGPQRDMLLSQVFKDAMANKTAITPEGEIPYTPEYTPLPANLRPGARPTPTAGGAGGASPSGSGVNTYNVGNVRPQGKSTGFQQPGSYDEGLKIMDDNLKSYAKQGIDTLRGVITKWSPPNENDTEALIKAAASRLGIKPDDKFDLNNPVVQRLIGSSIMLQEKPRKELFGTAPLSQVNAELAVNQGQEKIGQFSTQSKQGQELAIAAIKGDNESIIKEIQNPMLAKVAAEKDLPPQITRTLDILDKTKTGPGASTAQLTTEIKGFFKELKPDELQQLINQKTVSQTQATLIASGIKAAFGAQLSDKEGDRYVKTLFTIDDPKQFIRASLELKRAAVYSNKDFANFLLGKSDKAKAIREYENISEQRNDEILKKHAPTVWAQMQKASNEKPAAQPSNSNTAAETWLKANPNHPDAPAVRKKLGL
jgi:hypothetical protein